MHQYIKPFLSRDIQLIMQFCEAFLIETFLDFGYGICVSSFLIMAGTDGVLLFS